jgi:hypothetical protein
MLQETIAQQADRNAKLYEQNSTLSRSLGIAQNERDAALSGPSACKRELQAMTKRYTELRRAIAELLV